MSDYAHPILMSTPIFESHRRACGIQIQLKQITCIKDFADDKDIFGGIVVDRIPF